MKDKKDLKKLKEKEFAEKADRSKNTISLLRKHAFVLAVIVAALMLFSRAEGLQQLCWKPACNG